MVDVPPVMRFETSTGVRIYRISCEAFPGFVAHTYLLFGAGPVTLVDTGSGYGESDDHLRAGLATVRAKFGEAFDVPDIKRILITHGHIDHFGGLARLVKETGARVAIHELDRRILTNYAERVTVATQALKVFLARSGVGDELQAQMVAMFQYSKRHVVNVPVDITLVDGLEFDGLRFIHTPGHCPGQVCIAVGNVLLSADHVLLKITPHQSPESITAYTGLGHYFDALDKLRRDANFELTLGGHEGPIEDLPKRIEEIRQSHIRRLDRVLELLDQAERPQTVAELAQSMFRRARGFDVLLAFEEVGAHVEYLYERGKLAVDNFEDLGRESNPPLRYRRA
jgi:glyoxylase-like metal-dependent hydrolase (beta-lactamase superfamily II)